MRLPSFAVQLGTRLTGEPVYVDCGTAQTKITYKGKLLADIPSTVATLVGTKEFGTIGAPALDQIEISAKGSTHDLLIFERGRVWNAAAAKHFLRTALGQLTWLDGSPLSTLAPVYFVLSPDISQRETRSWQELIGSLDRITSLISVRQLHEQLPSLIKNPVWLLDMGYSQTHLALSSSDSYYQADPIPFGVRSVYNRIRRLLHTQGLTVTHKQLELITQQVVSAPPLANTQRKKRKMVYPIKQINTATVRRTVVSTEQLSSVLDVVFQEWVWLLRQTMMKLAHTAELHTVPKEIVAHGGGSAIRGMSHWLEEALVVTVQSLPFRQIHLVGAVAQSQYDK